MVKLKTSKKPALPPLAKSPTGIQGIDEITHGGLPKYRTSLVCGQAGCGKTMFATEFLINGATQFNEPGLFISFEETEDELIKNVTSLGFDLKKLINQKKVLIDFIYINRNEFEEVGQYNLDGLFIRLQHQIKKYGIKRIAIDTIEVLFSNLLDEAALRAELQRLFRWLKNNKLTAVVTAESGKNTLSRHGLEEYVADCVILFDQRVENQVSTRRLRVVKYRGSTHGTNEYPFLISTRGILVSPITSLSLDYKVSNRHISSGISRLDHMLEGKGFYEGSTILISGIAGAGKSSFAASFANSVCQKGKRCLYFAFEESISQIIRNMKSIGIDLDKWVKKGLLQFHVARPYSQGLESHLVIMHDLVTQFKPAAVIIDPISNLKSIDNANAVKTAMARLIDFLKTHQITALLTSLLSENGKPNPHEDNISSLMDTWILLQNIDTEGELNRSLSICKSRGIGHSNQTREIVITDKGIDLKDVYFESGKVLAGTARIERLAETKIQQIINEDEFKMRKRKALKKCAELESQIAVLTAELEIVKEEIMQAGKQKSFMKDLRTEKEVLISKARRADKEKNQ